ncbi:MAG: sulfite exporter TauE/SafE family protein [Minwuia sp.]|uniref:sulfite exporter TauE/SafE family protein n=1 Tax=Minwuia sp. TaxID=2493630 RepID=UPI003A86775F
MTDAVGVFAGLWHADTLILFLIAALTGLVRGFAGFGAAMVFVPLASILVLPQTAVITLWLMDFAIALPMTVRSFRSCNWTEIRPLFAGAVLGVPVGVWMLANLPPEPMKWIISVAVLAAVAGLASGWRRSRPLATPGVAAIGTVSGIGSGLSGLSGPPVIVFWASGQGTGAEMRTNIFAFFGLTGMMAGLMHFTFGLFTPERLALAAMLAPGYALAFWSGTRIFGFASEKTFRTFALSLCAVAALMVMPVWG